MVSNALTLMQMRRGIETHRPPMNFGLDLHLLNRKATKET
jgi:hypothetical protein